MAYDRYTEITGIVDLETGVLWVKALAPNDKTHTGESFSERLTAGLGGILIEPGIGSREHDPFMFAAGPGSEFNQKTVAFQLGAPVPTGEGDWPGEPQEVGSNYGYVEGWQNKSRPGEPSSDITPGDDEAPLPVREYPSM